MIVQQPAIILLAPHGEEPLSATGEPACIDDVLQKPIHSSQLLDAIATLFAKDRRRQRALPQTKLRDVDAIRGILGAKVLLAEDNPINQQVAAELLEMNGLVVTVAQDGQQAIAALQDAVFDLVLMDIQMPIMDGLEATMVLRKDPRFDHLPIVAMTAHALLEDRAKSLEAGMNDHLTKPIDPDHLFMVLVKWIPAKNRGAVLPQAPMAAPEVVLPNTLPGIDMAKGLRQVGDNRKLFRTLLVDFHEDYQESLPRLRALLHSGAYPDMQRLAHTLKGVAGSIGAESVFNAARILETTLQSGQVTAVDGLLQELESELIPLLQGLKALSAEEPDRSAEPSEASPRWEGDPALLRQPFLELTRLLQAGHSRSAQQLIVIGDLLGTSFRPRLASIEELIEAFEFEEALEQLETFAAEIGLTL
ncbi:MAG: response regulator [Magnetococcales bacterium]|nr:response regulator [Magnetococcales bacterium]